MLFPAPVKIIVDVVKLLKDNDAVYILAKNEVLQIIELMSSAEGIKKLRASQAKNTVNINQRKDFWRGKYSS